MFQSLLRTLRDSARDLAPIVLVIAAFQMLVLRQPVPNLLDLLVGCACVVLGLALFVRGLESGLFPMGAMLADGLARKASLPWLLVFAFGLGFGTTIAEPALIAVAEEAARVAAGEGIIGSEPRERDAYALGLRLSVAVAVGLAGLVGVYRILRGWPIHYLIIAGYAAIVVLTWFAPPDIIGLAYDSGGVTTSTVTVPLVAALGIGLASSIRGRNPLTDGFGLIAFAALTPIAAVMLYGIVGGMSG
ncbi:MAG: DUF1538 domain-containing protein [Immundisolibacterales bacterium]|nr:DUF1538 domain-containing protein [Immundisolibacterales bacterium]